MNHLLDDDDDLGAPRDREFTLSTAAILGLFFGLVVLCGAFFALGYSVRGPRQSADDKLPESSAPSSTPSTNFNSFKPSAGVAAGSSTAPPAPAADDATAAPVKASSTSQTGASSPIVLPSSSSSPTAAPIVRPATTTSSSIAETATPVPGSFMVQVAAVSHQEDADLLLSALKQRGYAVVAHVSPADQLIHIQIGPFPTRHDADAMRNRLLGDGYNAIVK